MLGVSCFERGQKGSRLKKEDSSVAGRRCVVLSLLIGVKGPLRLAPLLLSWLYRGAWSSKQKPGRGFDVKKHAASDCDLKNLRRVDEGAGTFKVTEVLISQSSSEESYLRC